MLEAVSDPPKEEFRSIACAVSNSRYMTLALQYVSRILESMTIEKCNLLLPRLLRSGSVDLQSNRWICIAGTKVVILAVQKDSDNQVSDFMRSNGSDSRRREISYIIGFSRCMALSSTIFPSKVFVLEAAALALRDTAFFHCSDASAGIEAGAPSTYGRYSIATAALVHISIKARHPFIRRRHLLVKQFKLIFVEK